MPDHGKIAPWRFIVFEGDARMKAGEIFARIFRLKNVTATPDQVDVEKKRFAHAPLVIAVVSKITEHPKVPPWEQQLSAGASAMNIVHAAHALGSRRDGRPIGGFGAAEVFSMSPTKVAVAGECSATESRLESRSSTKAVGWAVWATRAAVIGPLGPVLRIRACGNP